MTRRHARRKISTHVDLGRAEGLACAKNPIGMSGNFGTSGVRALPLAAGINKGGPYFRYWSELSACASGANLGRPLFLIFWYEQSVCAALGCWHKHRWPVF